MFTAAELVECAERELHRRRQVYPIQVHSGRMRQAHADRQINMMAEIARLLREQEQRELLPLQCPVPDIER